MYKYLYESTSMEYLITLLLYYKSQDHSLELIRNKIHSYILSIFSHSKVSFISFISFILYCIRIIYPYEIPYNDFRRKGYNEILDWIFSWERSILFD